MEYLSVLGLALLPALGNFSGGLLAELLTASRRTLSLALHLAAGVVLGVIAIELMPEALGGAPAWLAVAAFLAGGGFSVLLERMIDAVRDWLGGQAGTGAWMVYAAVAVDLFSDGLMIGAGSVVSFGLALLLAVGQVTADVPEGFAAIANFKDKGVSRGRRLLLSASFVLPSLLGASLGYWLLRGAPPAVQQAALAFTAGLLLVAAIEDMITEAHEAAADSRWSALSLVGGFALFTLVSAYFAP
jgi:ZIP family zinc transporter